MDSYGLVHFVQSNFVDVFYHVLTNYWIWAGFLNTIGMGGQQTQQGTGLKSLANRGLNHQNCHFDPKKMDLSPVVKACWILLQWFKEQIVIMAFDCTEFNQLFWSGGSSPTLENFQGTGRMSVGLVG